MSRTFARRSTRPESTATIAVQAIQPLIVRLRAFGIDVAKLTRSAGIDPACIDDPDGRVPLGHLDRLWERAAEATGDDCFGLHAAEHLSPYTFGILSYLGVTSGTWGDGLRRVCTCFPFFSDASDYRLEIATDSAALIATQSVLGAGSIRQRAEFSVAVMHCYGQKYIARAWRAIEVFFEHAKPAQLFEHRRIFQAPVRFGAGRMGFSFPRELLDAPLKTANSPRSAAFLRIASELSKKASSSAGFVERIRETIVASLQRGEISLGEVAKHMSMSARSVQRRLEQSGCSYQGLLDQVRRDIAISLLARPHESAVEVGFLLGFSEPAAFYRAFKRWTGLTPALYRESAKPAE